MGVIKNVVPTMGHNERSPTSRRDYPKRDFILSLNPFHQTIDHGGETIDSPTLHALHRVLPQQMGGRGQFYLGQERGPLAQCLDGGLHSADNHTAYISTLSIDDIDRHRRA